MIKRLAPGGHLGRSWGTGGALVLSSYAPGEALPPHEHEAPHICYQIAGGFEQQAGSTEHRLRRGELAAYPAGHAHRNRFGDSGGLCLNVAVPLDAAPRDMTIRAAPIWLRVTAACEAARLVSGAPGNRLDSEGFAAELIASLKGDRAMSAPADAAVHRVIDLLEADDRGDLRLAEIAVLADRHPTHLVRAFRRATGMSMGEYRRRRRLRDVCLALRGGEASLTTVAHRCGFSDQAHMTREFKAAFGTTPARWRAGR